MLSSIRVPAYIWESRWIQWPIIKIYCYANTTLIKLKKLSYILKGSKWVLKGYFRASCLVDFIFRDSVIEDPYFSVFRARR